MTEQATVEKQQTSEARPIWSAVVTLFPEMIEIFTRYGVLSQAIARGDLRVESINPREFTEDRHHTVDDGPYGGGPGMVMKVAPLRAAIEQARRQALLATGIPARVIHLSPQGSRLDQARVRALAATPAPMILIAGRYEAADQRVLDCCIDEELSVGDYVLTGGELPAMVVLDAVHRLREGMIGNRDSLSEESFEDGMLDHPHYTRPERLDIGAVPGVLLSGDHARIARWRHKMRLKAAFERRPDLLAGRALSAAERTFGSANAGKR